jgi:hypothetical protein
MSLGKTLSCKRIIWNDSDARSAAHWRYITGLIRNSTKEVSQADCEFIFVHNAETVFQLLKERDQKYDLIITQFGAESREAHKILLHMKILQVELMQCEGQDHRYVQLFQKFEDDEKGPNLSPWLFSILDIGLFCNKVFFLLS